MALFNKQNLKAVVSIEIKRGRTYKPIATGFLIGFVFKRSKDPSKTTYKIFLVTNRHVFEGKSNVWLRFDRKEKSGTKTFPVDLVVGGEKRWLFHRYKNVDLAMLTISPRFLTEKGIDWKFIAEDLFIYYKDFAEVGIAPGDEIFILGFPLGLVGETQSYALVRSGILSRIDNEIIKKTKAFLIDANIFPGNSGSPVFLKPKSEKLQNTIAVGQAYLLGTVSSYLTYKKNFYNLQTKPPSIGAISIENSGIGLVVPMDFAKQIYRTFIREKKQLEGEERGIKKVIENPEPLMVRCKKCGKEFSSGITMGRNSFKTVTLKDNKHQCPYCGELEIYNKEDYFYAS